MTIGNLSTYSYDTYAYLHSGTDTQAAAAGRAAMQRQMGVQNLGAALSLPDTAENQSALSNLDAYISGFYTRNQLASSQPALSTAPATPQNGVSKAQAYANAGSLAARMGLDLSPAATGTDTMAKAVTEASVTPDQYAQSLLQSNPASVVQVYQDALSNAFPGVLFSSDV